MNIYYFIKRLYLRAARDIFTQNRLLLPPALIKINTGYICNLRCPLCPTGLLNNNRVDQLSLETAEFFHKKIGKGYKISLYGWGEPFLNKDIFKIINYFKNKNYLIAIDSNLNLKEEIICKIEETEFEYLSVSLDGIDQQSYSKYRYNGNFNLAFNNMIRLKNSSKGPKKIVWQYLVSKKNIESLQEAKSLAEKFKIPIEIMNIGLYIDVFYNNSKNTEEEWWTEEQQLNKNADDLNAKQGICQYMYNEPFIDIDGLVYPCCHAVYAPTALLEEGYQNVFGNLHDNYLFEIWNGKYYQFMRSKFSSKSYKGEDCKPICLKCKVFLKCKKLSLNMQPYINMSQNG